MTAKRLFGALQIVLPEVANQVTVYKEHGNSKDAILLTMASYKGKARELIFRFSDEKNWNLTTKKGDK